MSTKPIISMNKDTASQFLPLVKALAEGKTIQHKLDDAGPWTDMKEVAFGTTPDPYRIKPEPREWWLVMRPDKQSGHAFDVPADAEAHKPIGGTVIHIQEVLP